MEKKSNYDYKKAREVLNEAMEQSYEDDQAGLFDNDDMVDFEIDVINWGTDLQLQQDEFEAEQEKDNSFDWERALINLEIMRTASNNADCDNENFQNFCCEIVDFAKDLIVNENEEECDCTSCSCDCEEDFEDENDEDFEEE